MPTATTAQLAQVWIEITGRCQLACRHCYAGSSPVGSHGTMTAADWCGVLDQAAASGVGLVTFIGGEPTTHPAFIELVEHALTLGLHVEVYSNLYRISESTWRLFEHPRLSLATSYYSDAAGEHDAVTLRRGSHERTRAAIAEAVLRSIPIRVGVVDLGGGQRIEQAVADLESLGVPPGAIAVDRVRSFGRGISPAATGTCGQCGHGRAAILPDGTVAPCVFTRESSCGSVADTTLPDIVASDRFAASVAALDAARGSVAADCMPNGCRPTSRCTPACAPACSPIK